MLVSTDKKWDYALGMIKVDGLEPSLEFKKLIEKEKRGEMTMEDMRKVLDKKYKMKEYIY
ncbi:MAG: antitoxin VbhA family protein [Lachnospiraceae bacterium]|jgi:hypothetical protein